MHLQMYSRLFTFPVSFQSTDVQQIDKIMANTSGEYYMRVAILA